MTNVKLKPLKDAQLQPTQKQLKISKYSFWTCIKSSKHN